VPVLGVGACAAFDVSDGTGAAAIDAGPSSEASNVTPDANAVDAGSSGTSGTADGGGLDGGGLDCTGALVCDDFERKAIKDGTHAYLPSQIDGTIGIVNGALDAVVEASTSPGNGPLAIVELVPTGPVPTGVAVATVDLDLELVERGNASAGYTNIMSVDLDSDEANFTIYLDGQANVQMLMKTEIEPKSFVVTSANAGKHHVHLEGTFQTTASFSVTIDGVLANRATFKARGLTTPSPRVELGARDVDVRGANHVTIDNFVVRVRPN
jgi:hypothetical protein